MEMAAIGIGIARSQKPKARGKIYHRATPLANAKPGV
jgi:hypothetical protein